VHQRSQAPGLYAADVADPCDERIATTPPSLGAWRASVRLDGRPKGELPTVVAGASPAYDLRRHRAGVTRIVLEAAR
jgi:hypothetical protein